jgi:uracil-DNA glycosylase
MKFREQIHPSWGKVLAGELDLLDEIESKIASESYLPKHDLVMRALSSDFDSAKVLILGQDPYPNPSDPVGLSFSIPPDKRKLPPTLKNIFKELNSDLGAPIPGHGDLTPWAQQGVVLLNRSLTCRSGESNSHSKIGWSTFTEACVSALAGSGCVAILWGAGAQESSKYFSQDKLIVSPHPSPLSAYRGFFGSKPFSRTNSALLASGFAPIDWSL